MRPKSLNPSRFLFCFFVFNVYSFLREEHECGRCRMREGDTESRSSLQAPSCQHRAWRGLELKNREIMTWAEVGRSTDCATQVPHSCFFLSFKRRAWHRAQAHEPWDHDLSWNQELDTQPPEPPRRPRRLLLFTGYPSAQFRFFIWNIYYLRSFKASICNWSPAHIC